MRITTVVLEEIGAPTIMRTTIRVEDGDKSVLDVPEKPGPSRFGIWSTGRRVEFEDTEGFRNWVCSLARDICFEHRGLQGA